MCVQARSKPVQPPKKPANAPFFLPTIAGLHSEPLFDPSAAVEAEIEESEKPSSNSRINKSAGERHLVPACISHHFQKCNDMWLQLTLALLEPLCSAPVQLLSTEVVGQDSRRST